MIIKKINGKEIPQIKLERKKATIADLDSLYNLQVETEKTGLKDSLGNPLFAAEPKHMIQEVLESEKGEINLFYNNGELVCYYEFSVPKSSKALEIFSLDKFIQNIDYRKVGIAKSFVVAEKFRGNKLQNQMINILELTAINSNIEYIISTVHKENVYSYKNLLDAGYKDLTNGEPIQLIYGKRLLLFKILK